MRMVVMMFALGLVLLSIIPQSVVIGEVYGDTAMKQIGQNETNGSEYLQGVANRLMIILGIAGGVIIAVMWIFVGLEFFSSDPQKKAQAKDHMLYAAIGTLIVVMAVGGAIWYIARWVAGT